MIEGYWSESNVIEFCGANGIHVTGSDILIHNTNTILSIQFIMSCDVCKNNKRTFQSLIEGCKQKRIH